jgi:hypothetical protein
VPEVMPCFHAIRLFLTGWASPQIGGGVSSAKLDALTIQYKLKTKQLSLVPRGGNSAKPQERGFHFHFISGGCVPMKQQNSGNPVSQ